MTLQESKESHGFNRGSMSTNLFLKRPGVIRSLHPTHSMAGYGKDAASYLAGEEMRNTPCTPGGCYDRLKDVGGKILSK